MGDSNAGPNNLQAGNLEAKIRELWLKFRPMMLARLEVIQEAFDYVGNAGPLAKQESAREEAHKLAGALGSFGLTHGSALASELEQAFSQPLDPARLAALRQQYQRLKALIEQHGAETP